MIKVIEAILFGSRWVLAALYLFLMVGLFAYCGKFFQELWDMIVSFQSLSTENMMLGLLGLVDITMVANLVVMVTIGGYSIFIKEIKSGHIKNPPRFMNHITSSGLKVKMCSSIVGVSSIHLLKKFIEASDAHLAVPRETMITMIVIHTIFIVGTIALAYVERLNNLGSAQKEEKHV